MRGTARIVSQFRTELVGRVVAMGAGTITTVALARLLGPDGYGLLFLAISVFTAVQLLGKLGIGRSAGRYVAEYKEVDPGQLPHILRTSFALNLVTIGIVAVALLVGYEAIADAFDQPELAPFLALGAAFVAASTLVTYARLVLQGFEAIGLAALVHVVDHASKLGFAVGLVLLGYGALGALAGYVAGYALAAGIGLGIVYVGFYRGAGAAPSMEPGLARRLAEYTVPLTATNTANVLDKQVDAILVGFFLNPLAVGYYVLAKQTVQLLETPTAALGFTLAPTYGVRKASGDTDRAARLYESAVSSQLLLYVPAGAGLFLVAGPTVEVVFGAEYLGAVPVLQVLALYAVLVAVNRVTSNGLDFLGRARERAIVKGVTAVLNVALNVALIPTIGVVGAAIATVITYGLYTVANVSVIALEFDLRRAALARHLAAVAGITAVMVVVVRGAMGYVRGPISLAGVVVLGGAVWLSLSTAAGLLETRHVRALLS